MFAAACGSTPPRLDPYGRPHDEANSMKPIKLLACSPTGLDRQPRLLRGTRPLFPIGEDMAGRTGSAYVVFHVDVGGKVLLADRTAENRWFGSHAELALRDWQMEPAIKDGRPIRATCRLQFDFMTRGAMERLQIEKA